MTIKLMSGTAAGASLTGNYSPWVSGRYYSQPGSSAMGSAVALSANYMWFVPIQVPNPCTITQIGWYGFISNSSASNSIGMYTDLIGATSLGPDRRLWVVSNHLPAFGSAAWNFATVPSGGIAVTTPQLLWVSFLFTQNCTAYGVSAGGSPTNFVASPGAQSSIGGLALLRSTSTLGALPATATTTAMTIPSAGAVPQIFCYAA